MAGKPYESGGSTPRYGTGPDLTAIDTPKARPNLHAGHDILRERGARIAERGRSLGHVDVAATQFPQEEPPGFEPGIKDLQ